MAFLKKMLLRRRAASIEKLNQKKQKAEREEEAKLGKGAFFRVADYHQNNDVQPTSVTTAPSSDGSASDCDCSETSSSSTPVTSWKSATQKSFVHNQPLVVPKECNSINNNNNGNPSNSDDYDEAEELGLAMQRSRKLPGTWYYSSNHIMVNIERRKRVVAPLTRLKELDEMARQHAANMAAKSQLFHSSPTDLLETTDNDESTKIMGENVACGKSIREIHRKMMSAPADRNNILNRRYTHMGMGTATIKGEGDANDTLYLCQIFRG